jgi:hypothetical protein
VIALYAITDHPAPSMPLLGTVRAIAAGDLAAVCGPAITGEMTAEALWEHERIVEALMDDRDVLPVRYGTYVSDDAAAAQALRDNHSAFAASLEAVRGAVELAVRVFAAGAATAAPMPSADMSGTEYLRGRARSAAEESDARAIVHEPLVGLARVGTAARATRAGELLRAAYLVDREATERFSLRVREIQEQNPELRITCTGPWPPYSFVSQ